MRDMIAYCGLDCEKCDAYLATINDDQALREKTAKLWSELIMRLFCRSISTVKAAAWMGQKRCIVKAFAVFANAHCKKA